MRIAQLEAGLSQLASDHQDKIAELRGLGFLRGLQLCPSYQAGDLNAALRDHHVLAVPAADNVLRLLPPLTISEDEINTLLGVLQTALKQI